ncbi:MAG TPA: hypothetical protein VG206_01155 [Terriglobia bacterium]|nr:hypothetical protein [Terriglobia bacterium]
MNPNNKQGLSKKDYADYEFIVKEIGRLLSLGGPKELLDYYRTHQADALFGTLPTEDGRSFPCSYEGVERFRQIVVRGVDALGLAGKKHSVKVLTHALKEKFVREAKEITANTTAENAHELFLCVAREEEAKHEELTHYIPCAVVTDRTPDRFAIRPVNFVLREIFMEENDDALRKEADSYPHGEFELQELREFFSKYSWVALVKAPPCDPEVSKARARLAIQRALNLIKLFFPSDRTRRVAQAGELTTPVNTSWLVSSDARGFTLSWSRRGLDAILTDNWFEQISAFDQWKIAEWVILTSWERWDEVPEPYQRFLDGLAWHGDAVSEPDAQARTIKFWTAIERVVSLRDSDPVVKRAALFSIETPGDYEARLKQASTLYTRRSMILHGSARYKDKRSIETASKTEDLSRRVLLSYLTNVVSLVRLRENATREDMTRLFQHFHSVIRGS